MTTRSRAGARSTYVCAECGWQSPKWVGRCGECQAWASVSERGVPQALRTAPAATAVTVAAQRIHEVAADDVTARPTGVDELDRVLGGGLVPGAVVLLAGEPGVGKSTLILEVASRYASPSRSTLYVTGEESAAQVHMRATRTGTLDPHLYLAAETDLGALLAHVEAVAPTLLVVDSVQTIGASDVEGTAGGVTQVREVAATLARVAKSRSMAVVLVGHVTKDGSIAGPRLLEHLVDVVLQFEGDKHSSLRLVRALKNRYGPSDEVGCFEMDDSGITGVADPSGLFVSATPLRPVAGCALTVVMEGRRPLVAEVQALLAPSVAGAQRRTTSGLDPSRVSLLLAVLEGRTSRREGPGPYSADVYTSTVGGMRITEPAADLAVALALASAASGVPVKRGTVALGEVGLAGDVRRVPGLSRRLTEAARLGFTTAIVPAGTGPLPDQVTSALHVMPVPDLAGALALGIPERSGR